MSIELEINTAEKAFEILKIAHDGGDIFSAGDAVIWDNDEDIDPWQQIQTFDFGHWLNHRIKVLGEHHSEINGPFLEAFEKTNSDLQRLYAFVKYGNADIRNLTQEDIEDFQIRVKVSEGCSEYLDNIKELVEKLGLEAVKKMSGNQLVVMVVGLGLIVSGTFGFSSYLEHRREIRSDELQSEERKAALDALRFAHKEQSDRFKEALDIMKSNSEASNRALQAALNTQSEIVKAISRTGPVEIDGNHIDKKDAKELSRNNRRVSQHKVIEQEFKVVGGSTPDPLNTQIIIEDIVSGKQIKVSFRDGIISGPARSLVFQALEKRQSIWLRLSIREMDGEIISADIDRVLPPRDETQTGSLAQKHSLMSRKTGRRLLTTSRKKYD